MGSKRTSAAHILAFRRAVRQHPKARFQMVALLVLAVSVVATFGLGVAAAALAWSFVYLHASRRKFRRLIHRELRDIESGEYVLLLRDFSYAWPSTLRVLLVQQGIPAVVIDDNMGSMLLKYARAVGGVRLYVLREHEARARSSLFPSGADCPHCQAPGASFHAMFQALAMATGAVPTILIPIPRGSWKCSHCGHRWRPPDDRKSPPPADSDSRMEQSS